MLDINEGYIDIYKAIEYQIKHGKYDSDPIYGDGSAGEQIAKILENCQWEIQKRITY